MYFITWVGSFILRCVFYYPGMYLITWVCIYYPGIFFTRIWNFVWSGFVLNLWAGYEYLYIGKYLSMKLSTWVQKLVVRRRYQAQIMPRKSWQARSIGYFLKFRLRWRPTNFISCLTLNPKITNNFISLVCKGHVFA
jgi:hypothetical protein